MSRTVSSAVQSAIEEAYGSRIKIKAVVDPSRTFFHALDSDYPYDAVDYSVPTDTPTGQCFCYDAFSDEVYTVVVDPTTGSMYGMDAGSASKNSLSLTADKDTKPAIRPLGNGTAYLYYWDTSNLKRSTITLSSWAVSGTITITIDYLPEGWTVSGGSPHILTNDHLAFVYKTSIGGLGCAFYDGLRWFHWEGRFFSPNTLSSLDWTIYSTAAKMGGKVFFYSTDVDTGEVRSVEYSPNKDTWTDSFVAVPADLSRFDITNAMLAGGHIHIAGQFHRTGDLEDAEVYSLVLRSKDGRNFSWDRFSLLSTLGYQFHIAADNNEKKLWAGDRNSIGVDDMSYFFHNSPSNRVELLPPSDIVRFNSTAKSGATIQVSAGKETYLDHNVVRKGSRIVIYFGYETTDGLVYTRYSNYIIDKVGAGFSEGVRQFSLSLVDEGMWKTDQIAFPFYAEILSKVTSHDDCDERDKMYPVSASHPDTPDFLYIDFWSNNYWDGDGAITGTEFRLREPGEGIGCARTPTTNYQGTSDDLLVKTIDLNDHPLLNDYPTFESTSIAVKLYGWEQVGNTTRPNSTWVCYAITAPTDDLTNKTATLATLTSTYQKFPQQYYSNEAGSYPIEYTVSGLTAGHALLYFGFSIQNTDASQNSSQLNMERLEVTGLDFDYLFTSSSRGWALSHPSGESREYLQMPATGIPSVMFLSKPYTTFNFMVSAEFIYEAGDEPLAYGTVGWGVVGLAADGENLICARLNKLNGTIQLILLRDGVETQLAWVDQSGTPEEIMLEHRDGMFRIYVLDTNWKLVLTHYYDEISNSVISTSETGIMHVGIYGAAVPPSFMCPSFNVLDGQGIGVLTAYDDTWSAGFPDSGKVVIDEILYSYESKLTSSLRFGPYQGRQSGSYNSYSEGGTSYNGWATEIALYLPDEDWDYVAGLLLSSGNGHTWEIIKTDWTVVHSTAGVPNPLRNRSRHYCEDHGGDVIGTNTRVFIVPGLMGITQEDDNPSYLHPFGSLVSLYGTDKIWAKKVAVTNMDLDSTVSDMLSQVCAVANVEAEFTGDWTSDSLAVSTTAVQLASTEELLPGGFDVRFTIPVLTSGHNIELYASNLFLNDTETISLKIANASGILEIISDPSGASASETIETVYSVYKTHEVKVYFHNEFLSVYIDDRLAYTYAYGEDNLTWPVDQVNLYIKASANYTLTNVTVVELFDWREAIYVESELSASSTIGSVIQDRPIEILPNTIGGLTFSYNMERDTVTYSNVISKKILHAHNKTNSTSRDAGSDAIVYFSDIAFVSDAKFAREEGFLTRVVKLASLESGASSAALMILKRSRERQRQHTLVLRPDIRLVPGDRLEFEYIMPGTDTLRSHAIITETVTIEIQEGKYRMALSGRESSVQPGRAILHAYLEGTT
jgi:hypothetical protein